MKKLLSLITICMITTLCISINSSAHPQLHLEII